jgi:hypothetical protein
MNSTGTGGPGGSGGGGAGGGSPLGTIPNATLGGGNGTVNTGGGGGGTKANGGGTAGSGGSGIVILRAPGNAQISASPGTNTVSTLPAPAGGCKVATFTVSGTLIAQ